METNKKEKLKAFFYGLPEGVLCPVLAVHGGYFGVEVEREMDGSRDYLYFFGLALGRAPWPPGLPEEMQRRNGGDCLVFRLIDRIRRAETGESKDPLPPELLQGLEDGRALRSGALRVQ